MNPVCIFQRADAPGAQVGECIRVQFPRAAGRLKAGQTVHIFLWAMYPSLREKPDWRMVDVRLQTGEAVVTAVREDWFSARVTQSIYGPVVVHKGRRAR